MLVTALLTYGWVSVFVAVFAVYPFAAEMFRQGDIPKRLVPATIGLGAITFTMDAMPGTPQIQNIIPTSRSEEHTSELQSLMRISYAVFCLKKQKTTRTIHIQQT